MNIKFSKRLTAFVITAIYSFMLVPAREFSEEFESNEFYVERNEIEKEKLSTEEKTALENMLKGDVICDDVFWGEYDEDYSEIKNTTCDTLFLIHKSRLYELLIKAKEELFNEKKGVYESEKEIEAEWENISKKIVEDYISQNSFSNFKESDETKCDYTEMEKEIFNALLCDLMQYENSIDENSVKTRADLVADQMISEVETESLQRFSRLFDSVEKADEYDEENLVIQKDEWFESFKKYIEDGIYKWQKIESNFLNAKYSYENEAGDKYADGVREWADAYDRLVEKKEEWKKQVELSFEEGLIAWEKKFTDLDEDINKAMEDYKNELLAESQQKSEAFKINCEIYTQTRSLLSTACNEIEQWFAVWSEKYDGIYSYWKTEDNTESKINPLKKYQTINEDNCGELKKVFSEVKKQYTDTVNDIELKNDEQLKNKYFELFNDENILYNELIIAEKWVDLICDYSDSLEECLENLKNAGFDYSDLTFVKSRYNSENAILKEECEMAAKQYEIYKKIYDFTSGDDFEKENIENLKADLSDAVALTDKTYEEYSLLLLQIENAKQEYEEAVERYENQKKVVNELLTELNSISTDYEISKYNDSYTKLTNLKNECISYINSMNAIIINPLITKISINQYVNLIENHYYEKVYEDSKVVVNALYDGFNCEYSNETGYYNYNVRGINELTRELYEKKKINESTIRNAEVYNNGYYDESKIIDTSELESLIKISTNLVAFIKDGIVPSDFSKQEYDTMVNANGLKSALFSQKKDAEVKRLLYDCIVNFKNENPEYYLMASDNEIDAFFNELNQITENNFCTDLVKDELSIYQNEIYKARNQKSEWSEIQQLCSDMSSIFECAININPLNYDIESFEFLFVDEVLEFELPEKIRLQKKEDSNNSSSVHKNYTEYTEESEMEFSSKERDVIKQLFLFDTMYEKSKILLKSSGKKLIKIYDEYQIFYEHYNKTKKEMEKFENLYEDELNKFNGNNSESCYNTVKSKLDHYNELICRVTEKYDELESARDNEYVLREICNLKENEYIFLENAAEKKFSPYENYLNTLSVYEEKLKLFENFQLQNENTDYNNHFALYDFSGNNVFDSLYDMSRIYRSSEIFKYEITNILNSQFEEYEKIKKEESGLFSNIVCETDTVNFEIKDIVKAFVKVEKVNNAYNISFNDNINFTENVLDKPYDYEKDCSDYLTEKCIVQYPDSGEPLLYSVSEIECGEFLKGLSDKIYTIDDLLLAECYLKALFTEKSLFEEGEDPRNKQNYTLDSIIDKMLDVNIYTEYQNNRINVIKDSYYKVIAANGQDDLAKFILFNEYNISDNLNLLEREKAVIAKNALLKVITHLETKQKEYKTKESVAITSASAMACAAVFPILSFFAAPSAALYVTAASYHRAAEDFEECANDIKNIINGYQIVIEDEENSAANIISMWMEKQNILKEIKEKTYTMLYGQNQISNEKITFSRFNNQIKEMLVNNDFDYNSYTISLFNNFDEIQDFEELFNRSTENQNCITTLDAMNCICDFLVEKYNQELLKVINCADKESINDDWNESLFLRELGIISFDTLIAESEVNLHREQEDYISAGFSILQSVYDNLLTEYYKNLIIEKENTLQLKKEKLNLQYQNWLKEMETSKKSGDLEWSKAEEKFKTKFIDWKDQFLDNFEKKEMEWNSEYENLLKDKAEWIDYNYTREALSSDMNINSEYELESRIAEISDRAEKISSNNENEYLYLIQNLNLDDICDLSGFDLISSNIENLNTQILRNAVDIFNSSKINLFDFESKEKINNTIKKLNNDIENVTCIQTSQLALETINNQINQTLNMIYENNINFEKWEKQLVLKDGYNYGNEIYRDAVVDSTVFESTIRKRQTVHRYEYFETIVPEISFSAASAKNSDIINFMLNKTYDDISIWNEEIFGSENSNGSEGLFAEHIGFAPEFIENVNTKLDRVKNISKPGSGQLGYVMLDYIWNSAESRSGYEQLGLPLYEKKLTSENQILGIELPTLRDVTAMVCDIIGNCTGQVWVSVIDDLLFGVMDLDFNQKSTDQVAISILKAGATSCIGSAASSAMNAVSNAAINQVLKTTANAGIKTAQSFLNSAAGSYLDAMSFSNGFSIDWERANSFLTNENVLKNSISAGMSCLINGSLDNLFLTDGTGRLLNDSYYNISGVKSLNSTLTTAAIAGTEMLLSGESTVNLLNAGGTGLLALTLSEAGVNAKISSAGHNLNIADAVNGISGISDVLWVAKAKSSASFGNENNLSLLNGINCLSYSGNKRAGELAKEIWEGDKIVNIKEMDAIGRIKGNVIEVSDKIAGNNDESAVQIASILLHEDVHSQIADEFLARKIGYSLYDEMSRLYDTKAGIYDNVSDIAFFTEAYKELGEDGLFMMLQLGEAFGHQNDGWDYYLAETVDPGWRQNMGDNFTNVLGNEWEKVVVDNLNNKKYDEAYQKYMKDEYDKYLSNEEVNKSDKKLSYEEFCKSGKAEYENKDVFKKTLFDKDGTLSDYRFIKRDFISLGLYGCVLSTAAYIAYSLTGKLYSLYEANEKCKEAGVFDAAYIYPGDNYRSAVNSLVGEEVLVEFERAVKSSEKNKLMNKIVSSDDAYFVIARVCNDSHATLLKSEQNDYDFNGSERTYQSLGVINPWFSTNPESKLGAQVYNMKDISNLTGYKVNKEYIEKYKNQKLYRETKIKEIKQLYSY